jgi:large subunit ribosomal protein L37Ae
MAVTKSVGTAKRFGARYGKTVKERVAKVEEQQRKKHKCPYCNKVKVKRISAGIWECRGCMAKFTGKAYSPTERILTRKPKDEEPMEDLLLEQPKEKEEKAQKFKLKKEKPIPKDYEDQESEESEDDNKKAQDETEEDTEEEIEEDTTETEEDIEDEPEEEAEEEEV